MRRKDAYDRDALHFAPFLLLPSPFPETEFQKALKLQVRIYGLQRFDERVWLRRRNRKLRGVAGFCEEAGNLSKLL